MMISRGGILVARLIASRIAATRGDVKMPVTTTEEIRLLAVLGRSKGVLGVDTAGMIVGATQLKYLQAHDVMLPREEVKFLSGEMSRDEAMALVQEGRSRNKSDTNDGRPSLFD